MPTLASIDRLTVRLQEAVAAQDWAELDLICDGLKLSLLSATIADRPDDVRKIQLALETAGEEIELRHRVRMRAGHDSAAWKLRADSGTAVLAGRIRPAAPDVETRSPIRERIMELLATANRPMTNSEIVERLGNDPGYVSKTLRGLAVDGLIRQRKVGTMLYNELAETSYRKMGVRKDSEQARAMIARATVTIESAKSPPAFRARKGDHAPAVARNAPEATAARNRSVVEEGVRSILSSNPPRIEYALNEA